MSFGEDVAELIERSSSPLLGKSGTWGRIELGEVAAILNGFPWKSELFTTTHGVPLIRIRDVSSGQTQTRYRGPIVDGYWVEPGDLLVGMDGDFNVRRWRSGRGLLNQRVCKITVDDRHYDRAFLEYILPAYLRAVNEATSSVTVKHLSSRTLASMPLPFPPISEQRRIVATLDTLTARLARARADLKRVPAVAKKYRRFTLDQAYRGELTRRWRIESPSSSPVVGRSDHELRAKYRTEEVESGPYEVPGGWQWWRLPALGGLDRGKSRHRPRNDPSLFGGPHPFIQTGDIRAAGQYLATFCETYSELGLAQSRKWPVGTVCITIAANIAETTVLKIPACFPDSVVGFEADAGRVFPEFIEYFIRTAKSDLTRFAPSTAQKNINLDTLSALVVPVPPYEEQKAILEKIKVAFARADRLEAEAARACALLDRLEAAILARAFRGELVPQDPDDEPASVLLDRIRARRAAVPKPLRRRRKDATSA